MKKLLLLLFLLLFLFHFGEAQDIVIRTDGQQIETKVQEILPDMIKYKKFSNLSGPLYSINIGDVSKIIFENGDEEVFTHKTTQTVQKQKNTFIDPRDGQEYEYVKIGNYTWMAQNLNYDLHHKYLDDKCSWAHTKDKENKKKYGRMYNYSAAYSSCPPGWHLSKNEEWADLWNTFGGRDVAGKALKATSEWPKGKNGTNESGFGAVPGGAKNLLGVYLRLGRQACFWTSNGLDYILRTRDDRINDLVTDGSFGLSVRCVKN